MERRADAEEDNGDKEIDKDIEMSLRMEEWTNKEMTGWRKTVVESVCDREKEGLHNSCRSLC